MDGFEKVTADLDREIGTKILTMIRDENRRHVERMRYLKSLLKAEPKAEVDSGADKY